MKTPVLPLGWILLGLSLCLSPLTLSAQDRSVRNNNLVSGRKPDTRNFNASYPPLKTPPAVKKTGRITSPGMSPSVTVSPRPQRRVTTAHMTSLYGTGSAQFSQREPSRSAISILPNGTVITSEAVYEQPMVTESGAPLNEFDLATPTMSPHEILYRNSAVAPPPPPVPASSRPSSVKPDLSKVKTAEKISPGLARSPYPPHSLLDIQGMRSGSLAEDPASRKVFRVP